MSKEAAAGDAGSPESGAHPIRTSKILRSLAEAGKAVRVGDLLSAMGLRAHGFAILLFVLPEALPLPIPSLSAVLGIPLVLVAGHLVIFGENGGLPRRVLSIQIPKTALALLSRYGAPALGALELLTRPRWQFMLKSDRLIGLVCLFLSVLLLLPIPFVNFPPALCLVVISLGMVQRDGLLVAAGLVLTALTTYALQFAANWLVSLFR